MVRVATVTSVLAFLGVTLACGGGVQSADERAWTALGYSEQVERQSRAYPGDDSPYFLVEERWLARQGQVVRVFKSEAKASLPDAEVTTALFAATVAHESEGSDGGLTCESKSVPFKVVTVCGPDAAAVSELLDQLEG